MGKKNVVSIEDRIPTLKQERKKKANRRLIFYLSIFFLLISIIVYLQSPLSDVRTIAVSGNSFVSDEKVIEQSGIAKGKNIWTINEAEASRAIKGNPVIHKADVNARLPWKVDITVTEFNHVGYAVQNESYYPILGTGQILKDKEQQTASGDAPLLIDFSDEDYLTEMTHELKRLPESILKLISEIHWQPTDDNERKIKLYMNDGYIVDGTIRNFADNMSVYPSIVSQLDTESKGIIHIGAGTYFEKFTTSEEENSEEEESGNENEE
ncbi:cell division protein DivIB [Lentibacillus kapialis]|uniref:Cell division protein DivIB n=1 Tax=Lentibacillus kapialis TaxID=340214 RepID=A0A917UV05_9BACI|nr:FtsQ-type POTRA domain-containing protein [Lentibacillus kapialis]GGJ86660.1 cell division protein DivIB [Lentibacillus kapialis]